MLNAISHFAEVREQIATLLKLDPSTGNEMHRWVRELFPICRSITGDGVRETLNYLRDLLPEMQVREVPSGTQAFDWTVPDEWNIRDAYILNEEGEKVIDFRQNNLHVVSYSEPVDQVISLDDLQKHLHSLPEQPDAIPYVTSYYQRRWGFCISDRERKMLKPGNYKVFIDSTLAPGYLTYGEVVLPGTEPEEVLLSTYVCHPSMANNELSGPVVTMALALWLKSLPKRRWTFRILFLPETIGSIVYLSRMLEHLRSHTIAGFVVTCVGDERSWGFMPSRLGGTLADRVALHVLKHHVGCYETYSFLERGSDERQYCSPGVDLPVVSIMRSKYGTYPEYHTSLDNLELVTPEGLGRSFEVLKYCLFTLENNYIYRAPIPCEPQLGRRGLYPTLSSMNSTDSDELALLVAARNMANLLAYADGEHDLLSIGELIGLPIEKCTVIARLLESKGLLIRH